MVEFLNAALAQSVERRSRKAKVMSSTLMGGSINVYKLHKFFK